MECIVCVRRMFEKPRVIDTSHAESAACSYLASSTVEKYYLHLHVFLYIYIIATPVIEQFSNIASSFIGKENGLMAYPRRGLMLICARSLPLFQFLTLGPLCSF